MAIDFQNFEDFDYEPGPVEGVDVARIPFDAADVRILRFAPGIGVPAHKHSKNALHIVLKGSLAGPDDQLLESGVVYACGGWEYGPWALPPELTEDEATYLLVIQPLETTVEYRAAED